VNLSARPNRDERRHPTGSSLWWGESWAFQMSDPLVGIDMQVRFTVYPRRRVAWFWAAVQRKGEPYVLCRDLEVPVPSQPDVLEIRSGALWSHAICETPWEHWTVAMEAYAVELEDPEEAWRQEHGNRIGLAFDLEWESATEPVEVLSGLAEFAEIAEGYRVTATVTGDIQIGDERRDITGSGMWSHCWGDLNDRWIQSLGGATGQSCILVSGSELHHQLRLAPVL
jgi:hypothetical protein